MLGKSNLIIGVSEYVERPVEAKSHPIVTQFIRSDINQIKSLRPDLILGFSDLQKDIARDLIGHGLNVFITNQRSLEEILDYIQMLGNMVGEGSKAEILVQSFREKISQFKKKAESFSRRPKVYFEEWDHPRFSAIRWVSELIDVCGGENIFHHKTGSMAREREVFDQEIRDLNPDVIFACWCGKKVKLETFSQREGYSNISAVQNKHVYELPPEIFLQPGPALFVDGLEQMFNILEQVALDLK